MKKLLTGHHIYIILIVPLMLFSVFILNSDGLLAQDTSQNRVISIKIDGTINPSTADYIKAAISNADEGSMQAVLILLDTPGGLLNSTRDIVKDIMNSPVPVIIYVYPKGSSATSAGVFITLSANVAAMSPGTSIGAAHPVSIGGEQNFPGKKDDNESSKGKDKSDSVMSEKVENYAVSFIKSIAEERGRNVKWAEKAVRESESITASQALKINVVDIVSPGISNLLNSVDGRIVKVRDGEVKLSTRDANVEYMEMSLKQKIINIISTPDIAFMLISIGSLGILLEFYNPGLIFPGVAGLMSLIIGFISLQIIPFNYGGLALLFLGLALFAAEIYVTSHGLLSIAGLICFVFGALLLFDTPGSDLRVGYDVIIATTLAIGLFFFFVGYLITKSFSVPVRGGYEGLLNQKGEVIEWSVNSGRVFVQGEYWYAYSDDTLEKGDAIKVVESKGELKIKVSKL